MEIKIWDGGLQAQEIDAIEKIKKAFSPSPLPNNKGKSMFPWKGYAGFRFVDSTGYEGEFDLVIVTHCNVLIIELKDWNNGDVRSEGEKWYKNSYLMGRSPVSVTRNKKFQLDNKLKPLKHKFTNKGYSPFVHFFVVMTGNSDFQKLSEAELHHTLGLDEFLKLADKNKFNAKFKPHPDAQVLNQDFDLFDALFLGKYTAPKQIRVDGYKANELIFEHPKKVYKEYQAVSEVSKQDEALLRIWNFNKLEGVKANTSDGRFEIVSREREVLQFIKHHNHDLYKHCLRSLTSVQKDDVTVEYSEVYELPPSHVRFNEFIGKYGPNFSDIDRINLVKLLIAKFADLHEIKVAHRDIGDHSLWISPAKEVALSNFISAYHQPAGTVGDYRKFLSVNNGLGIEHQQPKDKVTPYQEDIRALGLISWHILSDQRISRKSLDTVTEQLRKCDLWYVPVLLSAIEKQLYSNASEMFEALKRAEPTRDGVFAFDDAELESYQRTINHSRQFREDGQFIVETDEKEVYLSNGQLVKAWLNVSPSKDDPALGYKVLHFLRQIEKIRSVAPDYLPNIHEFGIATKSSSLFLVTDKAEGDQWGHLSLNDEERLLLIERLIAVIEHLHGLGMAHGDLHPENIIVNPVDDDFRITLIDIPDFSADLDEVKNHRYSPDNIDSCTTFERDIFAVMRLSIELLGIEWGEPSLEYPLIAEAIQQELSDTLYGFKDLARFRKSFKEPYVDSTSSVDISIRGDFAPITIYPDNGHLYLQIEKSNKKETDVRVRIMGIGGSVDLIYSSSEKGFIVGFPPRIRDSISVRDAESSQLELDFPIQISPNSIFNSTNLSKKLLGNEAFFRAVELVLNPEKKLMSDALTEQLKQAFAELESKPDFDQANDLEISASKLWQAILDTEIESHPSIEVAGDIVEVQDNYNELIIPYHSDIDVLGEFDKSDCIEVFKQDGEREVLLGEVVLKRSSLNEVRVTKIRQQIRNIKDGEAVFFRTKQDQASFAKRKAALERLLNREGLISNLAEYFDSSSEILATEYNIEITDSDFARYDRDDDQGNQISLNKAQRDAFTKLLQHGPLSLLQGPPGTGKTEFIAAFVHFLIEKKQAKRILLVSQSHEAVNTAAERIRKHCTRLNTSLDVVRFSNREGAVSPGLKDVFSSALVSEKRELFRAEVKYRVQALSQALGLQPEYLSELVSAELKIFKQIDNFWFEMEALSQSKIEEDKQLIKEVIVELDFTIRETLANQYGIEFSGASDLSKIKQMIVDKLNSDYGIRPDEATRAIALAKVSRDMLDVLETERVNYDEFFARSRQLVTGTCVGIGQHHIGIQSNQYDWVIIDEAARSIASELAIAMQSGSRILLVGDHHQLPPLYSDGHKKALARKLGISAKEADLDSVLQSDFARAFESPYGHQVGAALLTQYRMAPPIGDIVSETFYHGKLQNGDRNIPDIYHCAPEELRQVATWLDTSSLGKKCHHKSDRGTSIYNRCEADLIIDLLKKVSEIQEFVDLLKSTVKEGEPALGVICMYGEQNRLIRQKFKEVHWNDDFKKLVKIGTVDSYQGKENRIIILSVTRSDKDQTPGFLRTSNRINVALSRAMDRLLIVGASDMWRSRNKELPLGKVFKFMSDKEPNSGYKFINAKEVK